MTSPIIALKDGVTVVVVERRTSGFYRAVVVHSTNSSYPVGGHDITVSDNDIAEGRTLILPDAVVAGLIDLAPVNGPKLSIAELVARLTGR